MASSEPLQQPQESQTLTEPELGYMDNETDGQTSPTGSPTEPRDNLDGTGARSKERTAPETKAKDQSEEEKSESVFECNICLDVASDAVISMCGHLFCWPCLHQWLETRPHHQICPVCKAGIGRDKVVPLYGRGNHERKDPRDKPIPPRPRGQRPEPESSPGSQGPGFWSLGNSPGGFQMSFGIGAFPFGFFATNFNLGEGFVGGPQAPAGSPQYEEERFLNKLFLWVAFIFIFWLLLV